MLRLRLELSSFLYFHKLPRLTHVNPLDTSEFVLSKLDTAIAGVRGIELISSVYTGGLGIFSLLLALGAVLPGSGLEFVRGLLLAFAVLVGIAFYWLLRRLRRNRRTRLELLRKWQMEVFLRRKTVDSLKDENVRRLIELIQLVEDTDVSRTPNLEYDRDFMAIIGEQSTHLGHTG